MGRRRPGNGTWRATLTGLLIATGIAIGISSSTGATAAGSSGGLSWSTYFYPLRVGYVCTETIDSTGVNATETLTIAAVEHTAAGTNVTVDQSGDTQVGSKQTPTNGALHYTLRDDGSLVSTSANELISGTGAGTRGPTVFPSVKALVSGRTGRSSAVVAVPLSNSDLQQLQGALKPGQTSLNMKIGFINSGSLVPTLVVPMGEFHDVLKVTTKLRGLNVTNASSAGAQALNSALKPEIEKTSNIQTWYARDVGPVQVSIAGLTIKAQSCSG